MKCNKPILAIRTDASVQIGLGHLVRCISLACILKDVYEISFFCRHIPLTMEKELQTYPFDLKKISDESEYLQLLSSDVTTIIDGYGFDLFFQQMIKKTGARLVCVDDLAEGEFAADMIVNHSPGVHKSDYNTLSETQFALGPDYALLRSPFLCKDAEFALPNLRKNLLICFGGSDVHNITEKALKLSLDFKEFDKITIITGSAYRHEESLFHVLNRCENCEYHHAVDEQNMAELMFEADVAIVPASGILFEALATKNIVISGMYIENQEKNYTAFRNRHAFIDAGRFTENQIQSALKRIKTFHPADLIDGKSPARLKKLFKKLSLQN